MAYNIYQFSDESRGAEIITDKQASALSVTGVFSGNTIAPAVKFTSGATNGNVLLLTRNVVGSVTVAPLIIGVLSAPSAPVMDFESYVSITSVVLTTVANTDYAIRVMVGAQPRWIPLFKDAAIIGGAAF